MVQAAPTVEKPFRLRRELVRPSGGLAKAYVSLKGEGKYLYEAVNKENQTVEFLLADQDLLCPRIFVQFDFFVRVWHTNWVVAAFSLGAAFLFVPPAPRAPPVHCVQCDISSTLLEYSGFRGCR